MMENQKNFDNFKFNSNSGPVFDNLPVYIPEIGNESGINYRSVEIKSHSFPVRNARFLAGENIIFEPGDSAPDNQ